MWRIAQSVDNGVSGSAEVVERPASVAAVDTTDQSRCRLEAKIGAIIGVHFGLETVR
jgi:hypothetical protein